MSGDVQPRKRKDKKKRKDDGDQIPEKLHVPLLTNNNLNNEDVNIHLHKDEGTGGGICAKFVFFILFSALTVLIGLIITEYRGLTDLETTDPNSKFSQLFEGWVDSNSHDDHDEHVLDAIDGDHVENHGEDHNDISYEEDLGDYVDEEGNEDHSDEDDHEDEELVDARNRKEQDENNEELEPIDDSYEDEEPEEEDREEIDDEEEDDEDIDSVEEAKEFVASEEDDIEQDEDEPDDNQNEDYKHKELDDNEQKDFNENDEDDDQDIEQDDEDQEDDRLVSEEKLADDKDIDSKEGDLDLHQEEELNEDITSDKDSKEKSQNNNDVDDDNIDEKKEENIQLKSKTKETVEQDQEKIENGSVESSGMAVKIGVGLALLVVAHLVLVKKWRNAGDDTLPFDKPPPVIQDRRNTIIVPRAFKEVEPDMEQVQEDFSDEDEGEEEDDENNMEERSDVNSTKAKYEELATAYTRPVLQSNLNNEDIHGDYEYDDEEDEQYEEEIEEEEEEEYDNEEAEDVDDEDEELLQRLEARYGKLQKDNDTKSTENRDSDFAQRLEVDEYEYTNITNEDDYNIKDDIDEAQNSVENDTSHAIVLFDKILQKFPFSPRSLFGKALALDILADKKRSNDILKKSLHIYVQLLQTKKVPPALYQLAAERCINRMRFIGQYKNTIAIHKLIISRFPNDPKHLNNLVVTYLTINRIEDAKSILKQILRKWPENGFALVHYGFILKTWDNDLEKAVVYLKKGISTKEEGVIDGRFYFHLGDALVRLGKPEEAAEIYEEGRINKLFLSKNQRSLYNVPHLSAKPWWNSKDVPSYSKSLDLLVASWEQIRKEGLSILNEKGYFKDESENLKHTGEWKQFELYTRGQKNIKNCKICPITCSIIYQIPEARTCKRGQTKFSVMHPGTHIWPHCGPTNCRLRVHLGLKIPSNTFIRVADDVKSWKEGEVLIFDDSFEHEVWHNGTDFRLILIMDIWHPELTLSEINSLLPI
ncbi:aspartyl/asparaginyl beta-hydroxylase isoform X1 [Diorhabda carinulata]|uniref:aspartyl/asparaginyl beta-hydroxylase isoform X1 n=1 Tax=Diorhabda carinulata TaxID=1163345 RepID=UPI0025A1A9D2|nr:aspartyl/asparaginyl beta-hydroxylase isoform X1 [Diorhabda carinulata]